ncbi:MAG: ABC transporter permease [Coriobacteriales bacterium]|jgi:ABC-2 type transport system permease protein|nr:ABC transporter permease [Coriobacteriales bacterium]
MKKTLLVYVNSLARLRFLLVVSFLIGLGLCGAYLLFSTLGGSQETGAKAVALGVIDMDGTATAADLQDYLTDELDMELVAGDYDQLQTELIEKRISGIVEIPAGFEAALLAGRDDTPLLVTYTDDYANSAFTNAYLEQYTGSLQLLAAAADGDLEVYGELLDSAREQTPEVSVAARDEGAAERSNIWNGIIWVFAMFAIVVIILAQGMSNLLFDDRKAGTFRRVQASDVRPWQYIAGVCLAGFTVSLAMVVPVIAFLAAQGLGAEYHLGVIALLSLMEVLFVVGLALLCGLFLASRNTITAAVIASSTILNMIGGAWFPLEYAPQFMQTLAHFTPQYWFVQPIYIMAEGGSVNWPLNTLVLALFATLCFLLSGIRFATRSSQR